MAKTRNQIDPDPSTSNQASLWFPGHMKKALSELQDKIKNIDVLLEVRDARAPLASTNHTLINMLGNKPRIVLLNKSDLADERLNHIWEQWFKSNNEEVLFVSAHNSKSIKQIKDRIQKITLAKRDSFRRKGIRPPPMRTMLMGLPNTGKSTLINRLAKKSKTKTGNRPGITRNQEWIVISPQLELLDTPGIMPTVLQSEIQGLILSAAYIVKEERVGIEAAAQFLLSELLARPTSKFRTRYDLPVNEEEPLAIFKHIGVGMNRLTKQGQVDVTATQRQLINDFRKGLLGRFTLEFPPEIIKEEGESIEL